MAKVHKKILRERDKETQKLLMQLKDLTEKNLVMAGVVNRLMQVYPRCGLPANQWQWNSEQYIVACGNPKCPNRYRPLLGGITVDEFHQFTKIAGIVAEVEP